MLRRIPQSIPLDTKLHRASNYTGCPVFALLLITTSLYLGWVMDFIPSPPSVLSCAICKCYLVSMISLCDLCLYFDPPVGGTTAVRKGDTSTKLQGVPPFAPLVSCDILGSPFCFNAHHSFPFWREIDLLTDT